MFSIQECWKKRHSFCNFHGVYSLLCYCSINFLSCSMIDALSSELLETEPSNNNISPGPCSPLEISLSSLPALPPYCPISSADFFSFCDWCQNMHFYYFYWFFLRVPVPLSHLFQHASRIPGLSRSLSQEPPCAKVCLSQRIVGPKLAGRVKVKGKAKQAKPSSRSCNAISATLTP